MKSFPFDYALQHPMNNLLISLILLAITFYISMTHLSMLYSTSTNICSICVMSVLGPILLVLCLLFNFSMFVVINYIDVIVFLPIVVFENQTSSNGLINLFGVRNIGCGLGFFLPNMSLFY